MIIGTETIKLYAPWVHSLKEKRMIVKSIIAKVRNKFNVSIAEAEEQDIHQTIVLGLACVAGNTAHADSILDQINNYIQTITDADLIGIEREIK